jgi:enoyl-CoA hydratase
MTSASQPAAPASDVLSEPLRSLRIERSGFLTEVVLLGPGKGNAMGPDFWREVPRVFHALSADEATRAIIVRGAGGHFSYGLDLTSMGGTFASLTAGPQLALDRMRLLRMIGEMQDAFNAVAECSKPVIAAVTGRCIGAGLDLVSACDMRLATTDARFSLREVKVAIVADLGSLQRLPSIIGEGNTRELALTGKDIDAARALRMGLVNDVLEGEEALLAAARAMAQEIGKNPPLVVQGVKAIMNDRVRPEVTDGLRTVALWNSAFLQSEDLGEAMMAFMQRREPEFKGR